MVAAGDALDSERGRDSQRWIARKYELRIHHPRLRFPTAEPRAHPTRTPPPLEPQARLCPSVVVRRSRPLYPLDYMLYGSTMRPSGALRVAGMTVEQLEHDGNSDRRLAFGQPYRSDG
jgi:hypothetical protein